MAKRKLCLATLPELDGGIVNAAVNAALKRCEDDCRDRPGEERPRKVTLTIELTPVHNARGDLDSINVGCDVDDKIPKRQTKLFNMRATPDGTLWDELSPDDANQETIPLEDGDKAK